MRSRVLYLCYWSLSDGLTASTVLPSLWQLQKLDTIEKVLFVTIERGMAPIEKVKLELPSKVVHLPLYVKGLQTLRRYIQEFLILPKRLKRIIAKEEINFVIARGAPTGTMALAVSSVPFYVESFEPHADYMAEAGIWSRKGPKYWFQKKQEQKQSRKAAGLMTVTDTYRQRLLAEGVDPEKVVTVPCITDCRLFSYDSESRHDVRKKLGIPLEAVVGVYIGKYGGLYYEEEAFEIYKECFATIPSFHLLLLVPQKKEDILELLSDSNIDLSRVYIASVAHLDVPQYLSASDFAFATYKPGSATKYLSPVKVGEYWANGLPVLLTEGVGNESDIIEQEKGGAVFNLELKGSLEKALHKVQQIMSDPSHRREIPKLAQKYRSPEKLEAAYAYFFGPKENMP